MTSLNKIIQIYKRTQWIIVKQTDGLTHSDSLLQLPFRANCLNWVLGHIMVYRDKVLMLLGEAPILSEDEAILYKRESTPIKEKDAPVRMERLLEALDQSGDWIQAALKGFTPDRLDAELEEGKEQTVRDRIEFLQWHETYHVGQLEILRQLAGKNDSII